MIIGNRLRDLRIKKNLSQEQLGNIVGVSKSEICNYEKEQRTPPIEVLMEFMVLFGVTSDYLLGAELFATISSGETPEFVPMTKEELKFINELKKDKMVYDILLENPKRGADLIKKKIG